MNRAVLVRNRQFTVQPKVEPNQNLPNPGFSPVSNRPVLVHGSDFSSSVFSHCKKIIVF